MFVKVKRAPLYSFAIGIVLALQGCQQTPEQRNAGIYDMSQKMVRQNCFNLGTPYLIDECTRKNQIPYDEYNRQRKELLNHQATSAPTNASKPKNCIKRIPSDVITCTNSP